MTALKPYRGGMSADQDQSHLALWAIMATKLLISVDPRKFNAHSVSLVTNPEVIAIDQDPARLQGQRVIPPVNMTLSEQDARIIRQWKTTHLEGGSWKAAGRSLELLAHPEAGAVPGTEQDGVLQAGGRPEVWQRKLANGDWALLLFNNGAAAGLSVSCTGACWTRMGWATGQQISLRDVFARTNNGTAADGVSFPLRTNATVLLRLSR